MYFSLRKKKTKKKLNYLHHYQVLTSLGEKLTEAEADELMKTVEIDKNGNIKYEGKFYQYYYYVFFII